MPERRLYLLNKNQWVHYSRGPHRAILRGFPAAGDETEYPLPEQQAPLDTWLHEMADAARRVPVRSALAGLAAQGHGGDLTEDWHHTLALLSQSGWEPPGVPVVPWTPLRACYMALRQQTELARHRTHARDILAAREDALDLPDLFERSARQMDAYRNLREPLWPLRAGKRRWPQLHAGPLTPERLVALLDPARWAPDRVRWLPPREDLAFVPVGREVGPLRATGARFEDGSVGRRSGRGGMDLFLRSADEEGLPIVAEIKDAGDTNVFFALVQALTYAVELTTVHQFERLREHHGGSFGDLRPDRPPRCDVYIVCLGPTPHPLHEEAARLADRLLGRTEQAIARRIRRVAFIRAQLDGELRFEATHVANAPDA